MRSRDFLVQLFQEGPQVVRMAVIRTELTSTGKWKENVRWEELQALKSQAGYADRDAVEVFPCAADEMTASDMRHLWILQAEFLPFAWRA